MKRLSYWLSYCLSPFHRLEQNPMQHYWWNIWGKPNTFTVYQLNMSWKYRCLDVWTAAVLQYCLPDKSWKMIQCDFFTLDKESTTEFTLSGDVQFKHLKVYAEVCSYAHIFNSESGECMINWQTLPLQNIPFLKRYTGDSAEVRFKSFVKVRYDKKRYTLNAYKQGVRWNFTTSKVLLLLFC